jgi:parallel beta-helix repeat protein
MADGSIQPSTAPIYSVDNVTYTLTDNIAGVPASSNAIIIERDNIIVDGAGHTLQGTQAYVSTGIALDGISNVTIKNMNITAFGLVAIYLYSSSNNSIVGNNIANNGVGIWLDSSSNNTVTGNDITANDEAGIVLDSSSSNAIYNNNFINNAVQASIITTANNTWDNGYPSGGNYWSDYTGLDQKCGPSQDHPGSDGIGDMPYVIDSENQDNYPLMNPWTPPSGHNVAIISAISSKVVIDQGFTGNLTVYGANRGEYPETFKVTVYSNTTSVGSVALPLQSGSTISITLSWNTTGFAKGNYTISAYAWPVLGQTDTSNNNFTGGWVVVAMVGDITGSTPFVPDGTVDGRDISTVARSFGTVPGDLWWNANCDINNDGSIDGKDISIVARHFGQVDP